MEGFDHFANLFIAYYYGSYIHLDHKWHGYNQNCVYSKFYYITEGECEIKVGDTAYHGVPGRFFYIPAGTKHSFYHVNENYLTKYWTHFKFETGGDSIDKQFHLPLYVDVTENRKLMECFNAVVQPCTSLSDELKRNASLMEFFAIYLSCCEESGSVNPAGNDSEFNRVLTFMKSNLDRKPSIDELADLLHVHPNYFIRLFKSKTGMSPGKYLNSLRLEKAKSLLENTAIPVGSIMVQIGFEESSAFSHFFRLNTGYSPHEFRKLFGNYKK